MQRAEQSGLPALKGFARGLRLDNAAVAAALSSPWSQGQVEGQITRLKLLKRHMYGRAKFDLLRLRVLHTA
jgi:transposase